MMAQTVTTNVQERDINYLVDKLVKKYDPLQIYCFHRDEQLRKVKGSFGDHTETTNCDYWLLVVLEGVSRIESAIQDFGNAHYRLGKVTILAHGREGIAKSMAQGYTFFSRVYEGAELLYTKPFPSNPLRPTGDVQLPYVCPKQRFVIGLSRAEGFLQAAIQMRTTGHGSVSVFMLHQAVEQCCIALISLHMDYRCDIHNLYRLLMLCNVFADYPYHLFITGSLEDQIAFDQLVKSYCSARYGTSFEMQKSELDLLINKVKALLKFAKSGQSD